MPAEARLCLDDKQNSITVTLFEKHSEQTLPAPLKVSDNNS